MCLSVNLYKFSDCRPYWKYFSVDGVFYEKMFEKNRDLYVDCLLAVGLYDRV